MLFSVRQSRARVLVNASGVEESGDALPVFPVDRCIGEKLKTNSSGPCPSETRVLWQDSEHRSLTRFKPQTCHHSETTTGKIKVIRERVGLTPNEITPRVGAKTGAEILAYENDEDDLLVTVLWKYSKIAGCPIDNLIYDNLEVSFRDLRASDNFLRIL